MGRFDQKERPSRQEDERRSRSPVDRRRDLRSRSPTGRDSGSPALQDKKADPAAAAKAAAERINAQLKARTGIQHVDVPPVRSSASPSTVKSPSAGVSASVTGDVYTQDGDYIKDIEINDLRNRYTLTNGATQKTIKDDTGADVTTRGKYYPDKSMATPNEPPLYLHITSTTKDGLEKAIQKINDLMQQELPNLVDERRFRRREPEQVQRDEHGRRKWPEEKIPIDLEPIPGFNLRAQVVGHGGAYVKHIQGETRCRVQIKGRGSGFLEADSGRESDESMYLHVAGPDPDMVQRAKELCLDLLDNVKQQYEQFKERGPRERPGGYGNGYGNRGDRGDRNDRGERYSNHRDNNYSQGYNTRQAIGQASPGTTAEPTGDAAATQEWINQYYGGQDPYAAYGGYEAYMRMYWQYYQQQQGAATGAAVGSPPSANTYPVPSSAPHPGYEQPPPPPNEIPPPPPSGSPPGTGSYNAVPPPPGL